MGIGITDVCEGVIRMTEPDMYDSLEAALEQDNERFIWMLEELRIFPQLKLKDFEGI